MEGFESSGDWWVPGASSERVSGEVSFTPTEGVSLSLNGKLPFEGEQDEELLRMELSKDYPLLHGDLGQDGPVTVLNATITSAVSGGYSKSEEYLAQTMVVGEHLSENPSFERVDFFVDEIPAWTDASTVRPVIDRESVEEAVDFGEIEAVYAATGAEEYVADLGDLEVKLSNYSRISTGGNSTEMETVGVLRVIASDEASVNTLSECGDRALEYLSFAIGTGIYPDKVQLYTDLDQKPLDMYYTLLDYTKDRSSSGAEYLFRPTHTDFESTLQNWLNHCESASEVHQNYRLLIHRSNLSPRIRFLTTVIALEALYESKHPDETYLQEKEFDEIRSDIMEVVPDGTDIQAQMHGLLENVANDLSIKDKLVKLIESEQELIETFFDTGELASEARIQRNKVAHGSIEATPNEHYMLSKKLELVLEALLAREIGVPADHLPNALASRHQDLTDRLEINGDQAGF
ncbi:hypothetical protein GCM10009067_39000 [Haloarcula sebkhae]|nr:hypothetical protein GCM10009067_39000 [Haloarcula sebkhae]